MPKILVRALTVAAALAPALAGAQHAVVTADEVQAALRATPKAVVIDARTPLEYDQAHIPGAINLPPERVQADAKRLLPKAKSTPLVFYCRGPG
jgi:rhodanese-related sulfurtransferase